MTDTVETNSKYPLLDLLAEIELVDPDMYSPPRELEPNDKIILDISEDIWLRKAFCLAFHYIRETERLGVDIELFKKEEDKKTQERFETLVCVLVDIARYVLFVRYNLWGVRIDPPLVRSGWKIVECP
jgi:hypothetical protein